VVDYSKNTVERVYSLEVMPELPEVETIARRIAPHLLTKKLQKIVVLHQKCVRGSTTLVESACVTKVLRRAKLLLIHFDNGNSLLIHLKMTGQVLYQDEKMRLGGGHPTADWIADLPSKHTRAILEFSGNSRVFFNDMRLFGWIKVVSKLQLQQELKVFAPDVISPEISSEYFFGKLQQTRRPIKIVVMDQSVAAGVGNIYANDALHLSKLHPARLANSLSRPESDAVLVALQEVIYLGIAHQDATIHSFRHIDGFAGTYQDITRVYGRDGKLCQTCRTKIKKIKLGGRGTYFCPTCQPSSKSRDTALEL